jgi:Holliday junction resolvase RusA-like endonuclease|tara:strand:- start:735 stop:980 length:246 start_codon:yes stop_codon:yes gene_type:complete
MWVTVFYGSRRPDLDISLLLDSAQNYLFKNDRQVKEQHLFWRLDRENPRSEIIIKEIEIKNPHQSPKDWQGFCQRGTDQRG